MSLWVGWAGVNRSNNLIILRTARIIIPILHDLLCLFTVLFYFNLVQEQGVRKIRWDP